MARSRNISICTAALCAFFILAPAGAKAAQPSGPGDHGATPSPQAQKSKRPTDKTWTFEPSGAVRNNRKAAKAGGSSADKSRGRQIYIKKMKSEPWEPPLKSKEDMQIQLGKHMNLHGDVNSETLTLKDSKPSVDNSGTDMAFKERRRTAGAYAEVKGDDLSVSAGPEYTFDSQKIEMGRIKSEHDNNRLGLGLQLQMGF